MDGDNGDGNKKRKLRVLGGLSVDEFRHPSDQKATDALKKIPGIDKLFTKILEIGFERLFYVENVASNLRVTSKMFPRLYRSLTWACKILDVPEPGGCAEHVGARVGPKWPLRGAIGVAIRAAEAFAGTGQGTDKRIGEAPCI